MFHLFCGNNLTVILSRLHSSLQETSRQWRSSHGYVKRLCFKCLLVPCDTLSVMYLWTSHSQDYGIDFKDDDCPMKPFDCLCGSRFCRNAKRSKSESNHHENC